MASIKSAVSVGTVLGLLTCLVFPNSTSMWICTETDSVGDADPVEKTLSCRPYDPVQDGSDLSIRYEFFDDYFDRLNLELEVTANSISFEKVSIQLVVTCSDGRQPTRSITFSNIESGTSSSWDQGVTEGYDPLCREGSSLQRFFHLYRVGQGLEVRRMRNVRGGIRVILSWTVSNSGIDAPPRYSCSPVPPELAARVRRATTSSAGRRTVT